MREEGEGGEREGRRGEREGERKEMDRGGGEGGRRERATPVIIYLNSLQPNMNGNHQKLSYSDLTMHKFINFLFRVTIGELEIQYHCCMGHGT